MTVTKTAVLLFFVLIIFALSCFTTMGIWNQKSIMEATQSEETLLSMPKFSHIVWGFIFVGNLLNLIWQSIPENHSKIPTSARIWFALSCVFQGLWVVFLCYGHQLTAAVWAILLFLSLAQSCNKARCASSWVTFPLNLWFGWSTVIVVQQATLGFGKGLGMVFFDSWYWAMSVIVTLTIVATLWVALDSEVAFSLAISWGLFCIYWHSHMGLIKWTSLGSYTAVMFFVAVRLLKEAIKLAKKPKEVSMPPMELPIYLPAENNQHLADEVIFYPQPQGTPGQYFFYYPSYVQTADASMIPVIVPSAPEYYP